MALNLKGTGYIGIDGVSSFGSNYSLQIWVYKNSNTFSDWNGVIHRGNGTTAQGIYIRNDGILYHSNGSTRTTLDNMNNYTLNTWSNITITHDSSGTLKYYKDAVLIKTVTGIGTSINSADKLYLGTWLSYGILNMMIYETRIWNKVLSDSEISNNYAKSLIGNETNLTYYWKINEPSGTTVYDLGANKKNGVLSGTYEWNTSRPLSLYPYLIKQNSSYYTIKSTNYDSATTHNFTPLTLTGGTVPNISDIVTFGFDTLSSLTNNMTVNADTFIPYTKFNNIQIYKTDGTNIITPNIKVNGIKSTKSMCVANGDISKKVANNIDYFELINTQNGNGKIRLVVSNDKGITWYTTTDNGVTWTNLNLIIPLKDYVNLDTTELTNWNTSRDTILTSGINPIGMNSINFNTLSGNTIRFAYVLERPLYSDMVLIDTLRWQFDAIGSFKKMKDTEVDIELFTDLIKITPTISNDIMKININNSSNSSVGGSSTYSVEEW